MSTAPDDLTRPDGRTPSPELIELRKATRALRLHLDELPIDFNEELTGDRFFAGLAFMSGRQRYDCAESMIGAGFGGTVLGALARRCLSTVCAGFGFSKRQPLAACPSWATSSRSAATSAESCGSPAPAAATFHAGSCPRTSPTSRVSP